MIIIITAAAAKSHLVNTTIPSPETSSTSHSVFLDNTLDDELAYKHI